MMEPSIRLLRVRGIAIGAHWSWLLIFAIVVWSLGTALFPTTYPRLDGSTYLVMAATAAVLLFGSVLAHELGHALRGVREGLPVEGITLWLLGGVARLGGTPPSAGAEFRVAIYGPLVTVAAVVVFGTAALVGNQLGWPDAVQGVVDYLTRINGILLAFNLVPALPLDGGRVLRSWLWRRQGSFVAATRSAARAGQAFGITLIVVGMLDLFAGASLGGIWLAFLGWFLLQAAQSERAGAVVRQALQGARVRDVMRADPPVVAPELPVGELLSTVASRQRQSAYPVVDGGRLVGVVSLQAAGTVPPGDRRVRPVSQVMTPAPELVTVDADDDVLAVLPRLEEGGRAVVTERGRVVGALSPADLARAVEIEQVRRPPEPARRPRVAVWIVVGVVIVGAGLALFHPPYVVISPGAVVDVGPTISVSGAPVTPLRGRYLLTSVAISRPSALRALVAAVRPDRDVVPLAAVVPRAVPVEEYSRSQREVFRESRMAAAAAAARAAGLPVDIRGSGAEVVDVLGGSPAAESFRAGDVILAVDDQAVEQAGELGELIRSRPAGSTFRLTVERDGRRLDLVVPSRRLPEISGGVGIGVAVETRGLRVELPFQVRFDDVDVGGPSAGLAYAMAIADLLSPEDYANGRTIAATGTIDFDGDVGPVGGVEQKALAAEGAEADLFVVPAEEVEEAEVTGLGVRGADNLGGALALLHSAA